MTLNSSLRSGALVLSLLSFVACGGGGGGDDGGTRQPINRAPNAVASAMATTVNEFDTVTLDASGSTDPENAALSFNWSQTDGPTVTLSSSTAEQPTFDAPDVLAVNSPETLTFQLQVSDGSLTDTDTVDITVNDAGLGANSPPSADAGLDQSVDELSTVNLSGSGSDPDGDAITYSWTQQSGTMVTLTGDDTATPSFTAPDVTALNTPDVLVFRLSVSDGTANTTDDVQVTVNDVGLGVNSPPTADAGPDQNVSEQITVNLDGTGSSDPDGDTLSYSWVQIGTPAVSLAGATTANPSFMSPDVAPGSPVTLTFELTVGDGTDNDSDTVDIVVSEDVLSMVNLSGQVFYERPIPDANCRLNFVNPTDMPVRRATVMLLDSADNVLATTKSDDSGNYSFANINANTDVRVRVRAELVQTTGQQLYEVYVRDNTSNTSVSLDNRPIYDIDFPLFNTGVNHITDADFVATTGWDTAMNVYLPGSIRQAAPLAILDAFLEGVMLLQSVDTDVDMGRIDGFWSPNNTLIDDFDYDNFEDELSNGRLFTAFYTSDPDGGARNPSLFLRGDAEGRFPGNSTINTDEFDYSVTLHEWGHFFEDELARSDSVGGTHFIPGTVEPRVAFGEGWGYAIASIASRRPVLCDTRAPTANGSRLDVESFNSPAAVQGFMNEMSVATFLYDLFDTDNDSTDNDSIGFGPIYDTMTGLQRTTEAFTTLFSFGTYLLQNVDPSDVAFVESQLQRENVDIAGLDIWATNQTTAPTNWSDGQPVRDLLPLYTDLTPGDPAINLCVNSDEVEEIGHNAPGEWRYFRITTTGAARTWTITVTANPTPPPTTDPAPTPPDVIRDRADPDVFLYRDGVEVGRGWSGDDDQEVFVTPSLTADTYTLSFHDWRFDDEDASSDYPSQVCFDFTMN